MLKKKCMVGVMLAILGLTALMLIPASSSPSALEYDPWLDYNDDGAINFLDAILLGASFGTTGNPTKPVIINHNWKEGNFSFNLNPLGDVNFTISTSGFQTLTIYINAITPPKKMDGFLDIPPGQKFQVYLGFIVNGSIADERVEVLRSHGLLEIIPPQSPPWGATRPANFRATYSVGFSELKVWIWNNSTDYGLRGSVYYYLTT